eukprot:403338004
MNNDNGGQLIFMGVVNYPDLQLKCDSEKIQSLQQSLQLKKIRRRIKQIKKQDAIKESQEKIEASNLSPQVTESPQVLPNNNNTQLINKSDHQNSIENDQNLVQTDAVQISEINNTKSKFNLKNQLNDFKQQRKPKNRQINMKTNHLDTILDISEDLDDEMLSRKDSFEDSGNYQSNSRHLESHQSKTPQIIKQDSKSTRETQSIKNNNQDSKTLTLLKRSATQTSQKLVRSLNANLDQHQKRLDLKTHNFTVHNLNNEQNFMIIHPQYHVKLENNNNSNNFTVSQSSLTLTDRQYKVPQGVSNNSQILFSSNNQQQKKGWVQKHQSQFDVNNDYLDQEHFQIMSNNQSVQQGVQNSQLSSSPLNSNFQIMPRQIQDNPENLQHQGINRKKSPSIQVTETFPQNEIAKEEIVKILIKEISTEPV